ncbi:MAG: DUF4115 domain-containing protein [Deferribacteraceae bacterium]|jgi:cytoskeletal protein RodZ|nr:DUF4115 domain-containing protein [Deferribacteraceae bacterium]
MGKLGDYLREVRESKKLTLQDASKATAVRKHFLELLEQSRYEELPSYVHVHGFLSQYSKFLGLDFQNSIKPLLDEECQKDGFGQPKDELNAELSKPPSSLSVAQIISTVVVILIIALVGYVIYTNGLSSKRIATRTAPASPERTTPTEPPAVVAVTPIHEESEVLPIDNRTAVNTIAAVENAPSTDNRAAADTAAADAPSTVKVNTVLLKFSDDCWFHFVADNDNATAIDLIAPAGSSRAVQFNDYFLLDIGNAGGITLQHNSKEYTGFGAAWQPLKNVYFRVDENGVLQQSRSLPR